MSDEPTRRTLGPQVVSGLATRTTNAKEMAGAGRIGALWAAFGSQSAAAGFEDAPMGVYHDYESDHTGAYSLLVGLAQPERAPIPAAWTSLQIPADDYLVFRAEGEMPLALIQTWQRIWAWFDDTRPLVRAYTQDLELHDASGADICIGVRAR